MLADMTKVQCLYTKRSTLHIAMQIDLLITKPSLDVRLRRQEMSNPGHRRVNYGVLSSILSVLLLFQHVVRSLGLRLPPGVASVQCPTNSRIVSTLLHSFGRKIARTGRVNIISGIRERFFPSLEVCL